MNVYYSLRSRDCKIVLYNTTLQHVFLFGLYTKELYICIDNLKQSFLPYTNILN